jgi:hypothetical protein
MAEQDLRQPRLRGVHEGRIARQQRARRDDVQLVMDLLAHP